MQALHLLAPLQVGWLKEAGKVWSVRVMHEPEFVTKLFPF